MDHKLPTGPGRAEIPLEGSTARSGVWTWATKKESSKLLDSFFVAPSRIELLSKV